MSRNHEPLQGLENATQSASSYRPRYTPASSLSSFSHATSVMDNDNDNDNSDDDEEEEDWAVRQIPPSAASHHYQTPKMVVARPALVLDAASRPPPTTARKQQQRLNSNNSSNISRNNNNSNKAGKHTSWSRVPNNTITATSTTNNIPAVPFKTVQFADTTMTNTTSSPPHTAAHLAREAPMAGFLCKYGQHVTEYKRRFFVLQPATHLYYFLSPHDAQPRGCLDLHASWMEWNDEEEEHDVNNNNPEQQDHGQSTEFCICWPDPSHGGGEPRRVWLQASSREQARTWRQQLQTQRLDVAQRDLQKAHNQMAGYQARLGELTTTLQRYQLMEQDRNAANAEAEAGRTQVRAWEHATNILAQWIQQRIRSLDQNEGPTNQKTHLAHSKGGESNGQRDDNKKEGNTVDSDDNNSVEDENKEDQDSHNDNEDNDEDSKENRDIALNIDNSTSLEDDLKLALDQLPGNQFSSLHNACLSLETHWKLAVEESSTAVQDLTAANAVQQQAQKRLTKAEQQLLKLWEENCDMRRQLKQRKKEKRVLIQEVKSLQQQVQELSQLPKNVATSPVANNTALKISDLGIRGDNEENTQEEEQLINELEGHLSTSIQLHEQMLRTKSPWRATSQQPQPHPLRQSNITATPNPAPTNQTTSACAKSLFDDNEEEDEEELEEEDPSEESFEEKKDEIIHERSFPDQDFEVKDIMDVNDLDSVTSSTEHGTVSSVQAEMGDTIEKSAPTNHVTLHSKSKSETSELLLSPKSISGNDVIYNAGQPLLSPSPIPQASNHSSPDSTPYRPNPLLQLDDTPNRAEIDLTAKILQPRQSLITTSGHATLALACPLADVVGQTFSAGQRRDTNILNNELQIYHLTFYSQKIGIQFQKVPPPPAKARGLLTEAMTADLAGIPVAEEKGAAELRRIATLSTWAKSNESPSSKKGEVLEVATPVDAVLVCGFQGFDDSGPNVRPKLGARLVAFDGVSVEVGKWTFESIRKAIKMRGRPLTLSFRDDFLTTEQRRVLTRAVKEMEPTLTRRVVSYPKRESAMGVTSISSASVGSQDMDMMSEEGSVRSKHSWRSYHRDDHGEEEESSTQQQQNVPKHFAAQGSFGRRATFRSFSEAGSSTSSVYSAVGPLLANLLPNKSGGQTTPFTPEYMRRPQLSVTDTPQHQDFQAGLL